MPKDTPTYPTVETKSLAWPSVPSTLCYRMLRLFLGLYPRKGKDANCTDPSCISSTFAQDDLITGETLGSINPNRTFIRTGRTPFESLFIYNRSFR